MIRITPTEVLKRIAIFGEQHERRIGLANLKDFGESKLEKLVEIRGVVQPVRRFKQDGIVQLEPIRAGLALGETARCRSGRGRVVYGQVRESPFLAGIIDIDTIIHRNGLRSQSSSV